MVDLPVLRELSMAALGRALNEDEAELFHKYLSILTKWQKSQRLVGSTDPAWIQRELFADALVFDRFVPAGTRSLLDVGSGPGIPGLPLKIVRRELEVVLLESRAKRVSFLRAALRELAMPGVRVLGARAEDAVELYGRFDVVTARCAGTSDIVTAVGRRFLAGTGRLLISGPPHPAPRSGVQWAAVSVPGLGVRHLGVVQPARA